MGPAEASLILLRAPPPHLPTSSSLLPSPPSHALPPGPNFHDKTPESVSQPPRYDASKQININTAVTVRQTAVCAAWKHEPPNYSGSAQAACLPPPVQQQQPAVCTLVDQMPSKQLMARINGVLHQPLRMFLTDYRNY